MSWLWMFGIFCGWVTLFTWLHKGWTSYGPRIMAKISKHKDKKAEIEKLDILSESQRFCLGYLKHKNTRFFQAYTADTDIVALERMGLLIEHERTAAHRARYEVPKHIWDKILPAEERALRDLGQETPWDWRLKRRRF